jgi:hypothetical protein
LLEFREQGHRGKDRGKAGGMATCGPFLRVVTLADKVTILNAFPDRGLKP